MKTLLMLTLLAALSNPNDQRLFESGMAFQLNRNYEQALKEFNLLVQQYPQSSFADDALLQIGKYYYGNGDKQQAVPVFQRIMTDYPNSDSADNAYLFIGRIQMEEGDLEQAYNSLFHIKGAFPESDVLDESYALLGRISMLRGQFKKALYFQSRIYTRFSESDVYPRALMDAAVCYYRIGLPEEGLKMLSEVRGRVESDAARLDSAARVLLRYFLNRKYKKGRQYFALDSPELLQAGTGPVLYVSSGRDAAIQTIQPGNNKRRNTPDTVQAMFYSEATGLYWSTGDQLFSERERGGMRFTVEGAPLREITSFFIDNAGQYWLYDKDTNLVYLFDHDRKLVRKLALGNVDYIKFRPDGTVFVVRDSRDILEVRNMDGRALKQFSNYRDIVDLATDPLGNLYLLTDKGRRLVVLRPDFTVFQSTPLQTLTGSSNRYGHLAVDDAGTVYLSDSRARQIVKVY